MFVDWSKILRRSVVSTVEQIAAKTQQLPEELQQEVLHFVEFLWARAGEEDARTEELEWSRFSLAQAMRGMEDEDWPEISEDDIKR
ncbi:MAG: DUF2281 domain-containing protein [Ignavibacteriae bacterium]|nr:DUF2281 domain-containing protein [Ignavibacteriota bacterium]